MNGVAPNLVVVPVSVGIDWGYVQGTTVYASTICVAKIPSCESVSWQF